MTLTQKLTWSMRKEEIATMWLKIKLGFQVKPEKGDLELMNLLTPEDLQNALDRDAVFGSRRRM